MSLSSRKINNINNINSGPSQENNYNTFLLAFVLCAILLGIILIYFSQQFRVSRAIKNMDIYIKFQNIQSMKPSLLKDYKLCDFYVSSSYNSGLSGTQLIDYVEFCGAGPHDKALDLQVLLLKDRMNGTKSNEEFLVSMNG